MHAGSLLMQMGHGEQLASDIARFIMEEPVRSRKGAIFNRDLPGAARSLTQSPASSSEQLPCP